MELRLQKYISDCGVMSRRAAEKEILKGNITVNEIKAHIGQKINPETDVIKFQGQIIENTTRKTYVMVNKPRGYITTMSDEKQRKGIPELMSDLDVRVYPCGRLDMNSEGLLLLTNDGEIADKLMHPRTGLSKIYHVTIRGEISPEKLSILNGEMNIDGYDIIPVNVTIISRKEGVTRLRFELKEGRNRQIRNMCEKAEVEVLRLKRISIGRLNVGRLNPGQWRFLTKAEVEYLRSL